MPANDTPPRLKAPPGTTDTHMHIYDSRYPTAGTAAFTPPDALVANYLKVRARLGIERTVVVQPSTYGTDNRCTLDAIAALGPSTRGVVVVDQSVSDAELDWMTKIGVRGIRSSEAELQLTNLEPVEAIEKLVAFTWNYFIEHPEFLSLLATENLHRAKFLKQSKKVLQLHSPQVSMISDVLKRGAESGVFRRGVDPVYVYISIASLGIFYLSNRWTLSTIFARDLTAQDEIRAWGRHISTVILGSLRAQKPA